MLATCTTATTIGQEAETTLKELQQQWADIDAKLVAKENEMKSADGDVRKGCQQRQAHVLRDAR